MTDATCIFKVPPKTLPVKCKFTKNKSKNVIMTVSEFGTEPVNDFFEISIPNVKAPRSTATTDSFILKTYDGVDELIDFQDKYFSLTLKHPMLLNEISLTSSSQQVSETSKLKIRF
jgi:hypothetical protein